MRRQERRVLRGEIMLFALTIRVCGGLAYAHVRLVGASTVARIEESGRFESEGKGQSAGRAVVVDRTQLTVTKASSDSTDASLEACDTEMPRRRLTAARQRL